MQEPWDEDDDENKIALMVFRTPCLATCSALVMSLLMRKVVFSRFSPWTFEVDLILGEQQNLQKGLSTHSVGAYPSF